MAAPIETASADTTAKVAAVAPADGQSEAATGLTAADSTVRQTVKAEIANALANERATTTATDRTDALVAKLNNTTPANFGEGSAKFRRVDKSLVKLIISYLTKNPEASVYVNGYASSDGSLAIKKTVSQARADAFKTYLVSKNITQNRVVATGKGIENPITSNDTETGRKKNRRVEVTFQ